MDKVNQSLSMFGMKAVSEKKDDLWKHTEQRMYTSGNLCRNIELCLPSDMKSAIEALIEERIEILVKRK